MLTTRDPSPAENHQTSCRQITFGQEYKFWPVQPHTFSEPSFQSIKARALYLIALQFEYPNKTLVSSESFVQSQKLQFYSL